MPQFVAIRALARGPWLRVRTVTKMSPPENPVATPVATGGTFAAGAYFWRVSAIDAQGNETGPSDEFTATIAANGKATLTWDAVPGAAQYKVYRGTASGAENHMVGAVTAPTLSDTGATGDAASLPTGQAAFSRAAFETEVPHDHDVVVDLDDEATRKVLNRGNSIGQYVVTAVNSTTAAGALPSND